MIEPRLVAIALCRVVAFAALVLAGAVGLTVLWGRPALVLLCSLWGRLIPDLNGRDWATVVLAASAVVVTYIALSVPGLILFLWKII